MCASFTQDEPTELLGVSRWKDHLPVHPCPCFERPYGSRVREIQEELDCTIKALQVFNDYTHEYEHIFVNLITVLCELVQGTPNANEHAELRWVSKSQLNKLNWAPADLPAVHELMK